LYSEAAAEHTEEPVVYRALSPVPCAIGGCHQIMKPIWPLCKNSHAQSGFALCGECDLLTRANQPRCDRAWTCCCLGKQLKFKVWREQEKR
jgi:hypothetical protein